MKISAVISPDKLKIRRVKLNNPSGLASFFVIASGLLFGCIIYLLFDDELFKSDIADYFIRFATDFSNKNKPEIISGLIISGLPYFLVMFLLGTSAIGAPLALLFSIIKSAGLGAISCYIYSTYSLKGIEYCLLVLFPGKVVYLFAMLLLTQSSFATSRKISSLIKDGTSTELALDRYIIRSALIYILFILSALIDFLTVSGFSSLFSFG